VSTWRSFQNRKTQSARAWSVARLRLDGDVEVAVRIICLAVASTFRTIIKPGVTQLDMYRVIVLSSSLSLHSSVSFALCRKAVRCVARYATAAMSVPQKRARSKEVVLQHNKLMAWPSERGKNHHSSCYVWSKLKFAGVAADHLRSHHPTPTGFLKSLTRSSVPHQQWATSHIGERRH
jgi:hypothetical protein